MIRWPICTIALFIFGLGACQKAWVNEQLQPYTPLAQLGRHLFFEKRLSALGSKSCGTCHDPHFAFTDGYRRSPGLYADPLQHNAPSLLNTRYLKRLNWSPPGIQGFEEQMMRPLFTNDPPEMGLRPSVQLGHFQWAYPDQHGLPLDSVIMTLMAQSPYPELLATAYPDGLGLTQDRLLKAIAAYENTLVAFHSPFDQVRSGARASLSVEQKKGQRIFNSPKAKCSICHQGPLFTDEQYHSIGSHAQVRTPSLRNACLTAPYFHDGRVDYLPAALSEPGHGQDLTTDERLALIHFLEALTDSSVLVNSWFFPPE